ncbi:MAG: metallophosphoesterase family protein [Pseudanabaenaceae cyanobacterium]
MLSLLHFADVHLGTLSHGRPHPTTGLNSRIEDIHRNLTLCIDRALAEPADAVLFGGDAFPDATPPPMVQHLFAEQLRRLADAGIPTVLLVGNHDRHGSERGGSSLGIYRTLGVPGCVVGDRLTTHRLMTRNGLLQVITVPWLTRSALMTRPETEGLPAAAVDRLLQERLALALAGELRQCDATIPTVLLVHATVDTATYGAERLLAAGRGFTVPLAVLSQPEVDYVALGHIHKHQILGDRPPVVYPGSLERVDFGEEHEAKGYCWVRLRRGHAEVEFCPLPARRFQTLQLDLTTVSDPQATLLQAIAHANLTEAVVRVRYRIDGAGLARIVESELHQALAIAHSYTLLPEVVTPQTRRHLPKFGQSLEPLALLEMYLMEREDLAPWRSDLLTAAQALMAEETPLPLFRSP